MTEQIQTFNEVFSRYLDTLDLYTNAITKAHGASHPEAFEIRELFNAMKRKFSGENIEDLTAEFAQLRKITNNYIVPGDVCQTYEATYEMLSQLDEVYKS